MVNVPLQEFFNELNLGEFFDLNDNNDNLLYYARFHNPVTDESYVIPETTLSLFLDELGKEYNTYITEPFMGFVSDLDEIWWFNQVDGKRVISNPDGIVGVVIYDTRNKYYQRCHINFYRVKKVSDGWFNSAPQDHFQVKLIREWVLDTTFMVKDEQDNV